MQAVWIVAIAVGLPVLSTTTIGISRMYFKHKEKERDALKGAESDSLGVMQSELSALRRRVENLEAILLDLDRR